MNEANANTELTLTPGPDGVLLLTTDGVSAMQAADEDGVAVFAADAIVIGAGEAMVVRAPDDRPVKVRAARMEVADGGRVVMETNAEIHAELGVFARESPLWFVGADGRPGTRGLDRQRGGVFVPDGEQHGQPGGDGEPGGAGQPGPGGRVYVGELQGTLTVIAGGGNGGAGGGGGRGGDGGLSQSFIPGDGGDGGRGGLGGHGGDGGTVLIAFGRLGAGATINPVTKPAVGGDGAAGGAGGTGAQGPLGRTGQPGRAGEPGKHGDNGAVPVFLIRSGD